MSDRNYRYIEGFPLGKYRRDVEPVPERPELNSDGLRNLLAWRDESLKGRPFLDDLNGHYLFFPSPNGAKAYTHNVIKPRMPKRASTMLVSELRVYFDARRNAKAAAKRQPLHVAEGAEQALALFWIAAADRSEQIDKVLGKVANQEPLTGSDEVETATAFAADAIIDLGLCLEEPVDTTYVPGTGRKPRISLHLKEKFDEFTPDIGTQVVNYGSFLWDNPEEFASTDGVTLLQAASVEQVRRINAWQPRHAALEKQFPKLQLSEEVLLGRIPLQEVLFGIDQLREGN